MLYNPFKPHICQKGDYYIVRKWFFVWWYFDSSTRWYFFNFDWTKYDTIEAAETALLTAQPKFIKSL